MKQRVGDRRDGGLHLQALGLRERQRRVWLEGVWPMICWAMGPPRSRGTQEEQVGRLGIPLRSPCGAVHLGLRSLQLTARPLPGSCLLIQLLPQPCRLRLQGSRPGPQGQLRSGLLLQQLLKVDGRMDVTCGQERGEAWGEPGGERWAGITWASWSWASMLVSSLLSLMALDSASLSAPDTISSSACREGTSLMAASSQPTPPLLCL